VEGHPGSGLSIRAYCAQRGVREHGFYWWRSKLARRDADPPATFVPVTVTAETPLPTPVGRVEIVLPGDWRVRVSGPVDRQMLADVSGNLFLFVGRGKDRLKILYWDGDGFALWYKRLEEGAFKLPAVKNAGASVELKATELAMLLEGIDLKSIKRSKRFSRQAAAVA
jgi:hypothetical protein